MRVLASTAAVTTACIFPAFAVGSMAVQIRRDLEFGPAGIGIGMAAFFAAASLLSALAGRFAERVGPEWTLRIAGAASAASSLAVAIGARSLVVLCLLLAVSGGANALCQPAANLMIARALPAERQGLGLAVKQSAIPMATLLAGVTVPAIALTIGWEWGFFAGAVFALLTVFAQPRPGVVSTTAPEGASGMRVVPMAIMVALATGVGLGASAAGALGSFFVSAAVDADLSEGSAGLLLTAGSLAGIAMRLLSGIQADRRTGGHLRVVAIMLALGAGCFAALASSEKVVYLIATPAAFATGWAWPGLFNLAVVRANPASPAAATGITQTGTYVGAVVGPLMFGAVATNVSYGAAWLVCAALAASASVLMVYARARLRAWRATASEMMPLPPLPA